jgi:hypothetical protein
MTWAEEHPDCEPIDPNLATGVYDGPSDRLIINKDKYVILFEHQSELQVDLVIAKRKECKA